MKNDQSDTNLIPINEAAALLGKNVETLRRWDRSGVLTAVKVGQRGHRKYRKEDIEKLMEGKKEDFPSLTHPTTADNKHLPSLSAKQERVFKYLGTKNQVAANTYLGALIALGNLTNPERIPQAAHSLRELTNIYFRVSDNDETEEIKEINFGVVAKDLDMGALSDAGLIEVRKMLEKLSQADRNIKKIEERLIKEGLLLPLAHTTASLWNKTNRWFVIASHHGENTKSDEQFMSYLDLLENHLLSHLGQYYDAIDEIDALISKKEPTGQDLIKLKSLIKRPSHYEYFFKHLNNYNWLRLLIKDNTGFFNFTDPPPLIQETDGVRYAIWIEIELLKRLVEQKPKEVAEIILKTNPTDNPWVHDDFMESVVKMPVDIAATLLNKIGKEQWFKGPFSSRCAEKGGELITRFLESDKINEAFKLADILFSFEMVEEDNTFFQTGEGGKTHKRYKAHPRFDEWEYKQLLESKAPDLTTVDPIKTASLFQKKLEVVIKSERGSTDYKDDNFMYISRPAIEVNESNWSDDIKNQLVTVLRDIIEKLGMTDQHKLKTVVSNLSHLEGTYPIMLRLQLHIYKMYPQLFQEEIERIFSDKKLYFNSAISHEYNLLLKELFPVLPKKTKSNILKWIEKGPTRKDIDLKKWQAHKLALIQPHLNKQWKQYYQEITSDYTPNETENLSSVTTRVGPTSPVSEQELAEKEVNDIINLLSTWVPQKDLMAPSPEGLSREFGKVVADNPNTFNTNLLKFFEAKVRPVYLYSLFEGLKDAISKNNDLEWGNILDLCDRITAVKSPYDFPKDEGFYQTGWTGVRKSIIDLLEEGLKKRLNQIPFEYRECVWTIINRLVEDPDCGKEDESENKGRRFDPVEISINTVRGKAFSALVHYALWCTRNIYPDEKKKILVPEVKKVLSDHLRSDTSLAVRSVYGQYFPFFYYLDKKWTNYKLPKIFKPFSNKLGQSAWLGYVGYANYWVPAVKALRPIYILATKKINTSDDRDNFSDRISEHLMIGYWRGDLTLDDEIIKNFFVNASDKIKAHAVWFLWRSLVDAKLKKDSPEWKRLRAYWELRTSQDQLTLSDELSRFCDWLTVVPEDINSLYPLIIKIIPHVSRGGDVGHLVEFLKQNLDINLDLVADVLLQLSSKNREDFKYRLHDSDITLILQSIAERGSEEAKDKAIKTIDEFGNRGNDIFRPIRNQILKNKK